MVAGNGQAVNDAPIQAANDDSPPSNEKLYATYHAPLLGYASSLTRDVDDAADLVQETWISVMVSHRGRVPMGRTFAWLKVILFNLFASQARRSRRRSRLLQANLTLDLDDSIPDSVATRLDITEALKTLSFRQKAVVYLRMIEDRSTRDTASALGCSEGTVKATLSAALHRLRPVLSRRNTDDL